MKVKFVFTPRAKRFLFDRRTVRVGVRGRSLYDGTGELSAVGKATVHEFGTKDVPARPFLRPVVYNKDKVATAVREAYAKFDLALVGLFLAGEVRTYLTFLEDGQRWRNIVVPPLQQETIDRKGSDALLIETGNLRQSIDSEVI